MDQYDEDYGEYDPADLMDHPGKPLDLVFTKDSLVTLFANFIF